MKPTRRPPATVTDDHGVRHPRGTVDGCGTGVLLLLVLLTLGALCVVLEIR
jgi:hypothetical protein